MSALKAVQLLVEVSPTADILAALRAMSLPPCIAQKYSPYWITPKSSAIKGSITRANSTAAAPRSERPRRRTDIVHTPLADSCQQEENIGNLSVLGAFRQISGSGITFRRRRPP